MPKANAKVKLTNRGPAGLLSRGGGKLTNRGPAGVLAKMATPQVAEADVSVPEAKPAVKGKANNIRQSLTKVEIVDIDSLTPDPLNARLHPERNIEAIKESLARFGQATPLTVKKKGRVVMKGNGTLEAAIQLGWTKIAAHFVDFSDLDALSYGVADNRTAEHARWDFKVLSEIQAKLDAADLPGLIAWTDEEVAVLRANEEPYLATLGTPEGDQTWQELWKGMPEFDQQDLSSVRHLVVHFRSEEDFTAFLKLVKQVSGDVRQKSIWYPKAEIGRFADKRYMSKADSDGKQKGKAK
jgi:hypothetical protein